MGVNTGSTRACTAISTVVVDPTEVCGGRAATEAVAARGQQAATSPTSRTSVAPAPR